MKPEQQVVGSAENMQRALDAGLPREQLLLLVNARAARIAGQEPDDAVLDVVEALRHPAAAEFDEVFVRREMRRLR